MFRSVLHEMSETHAQPPVLFIHFSQIAARIIRRFIFSSSTPSSS